MELIEIFKALNGTNNLVVVGSAIASALLLIAYKLSWIRGKKTVDDAVEGAQLTQVDGLQASYGRQLASMDERLTDLTEKVERMSETIHKQQIRITRLQVITIQTKGLLVNAGIAIPPHINEEIDELLGGAP